MADSIPANKARARLALRAAKASGLDALPLRAAGRSSAAAPSPSSQPSPVTRSADAATNPAGAVAPRRFATTAPNPTATPTATPTAPPTAILTSTPAPMPARVAAAKAAPAALFRTDDRPFTADLLPADQRRVVLNQLDADHVQGCVKCRLCETRTHTVFGEGNVEAKIMFVGEGPGEDEDQSGRPFVGRAGNLLNKMITGGMGLTRDQVYIANVVKCRPPGNRVPAPDEAGACLPYLMRQIEVVRPAVVVSLGLTAAKLLLNDNKLAMGKIRGTWRDWRGLKLMPTYHPAYLLRQYTAETRKAVWDDLIEVLTFLKLPLPTSRGAAAE